MLNVIVLSGGASSEREISLRSGAAVAEALRAKGYDVDSADPADSLEALLPRLKAANVVFPALHGAGGEDGVLQKFLENHNIKYVGSSSQASGLCFDKTRYSKLLETHSIDQPRTALVNYEAFQISDLSKAPFVLKPNNGGSSIDTFIVHDILHTPTNAIAQAFKRYDTLLLQELIKGVEITVGVLGDKALPVIEIIPPANQDFDYENKYNGATQELCPPQHLSASVQAKAQSLARRIHELTGCNHMSRTDMIVNNKNELVVLETNTIPGLTDQSLLPKAAACSGIDMPTMVSQLVETAAA